MLQARQSLSLFAEAKIEIKCEPKVSINLKRTWSGPKAEAGGAISLISEVPTSGCARASVGVGNLKWLVERGVKSGFKCEAKFDPYKASGERLVCKLEFVGIREYYETQRSPDQPVVTEYKEWCGPHDIWTAKL